MEINSGSCSRRLSAERVVPGRCLSEERQQHLGTLPEGLSPGLRPAGDFQLALRSGPSLTVPAVQCAQAAPPLMMQPWGREWWILVCSRLFARGRAAPNTRYFCRLQRPLDPIAVDPLG